MAGLSENNAGEQHEQQQDQQGQPEQQQGQLEKGDVAKELPPLSAADFQTYNRLAELMDLYHEHFRSSWNMLWTACTTGQRPQGMTARQLLRAGERFTSSLTMHHDIEEKHMFPLLAARMPEFRPTNGPMVTAHRAIHAGLDATAEYFRACLAGEQDLQLPRLRAKMEPWGAVLWAHLDDEVRALGAANMRKYWSKEDMRSLPM